MSALEKAFSDAMLAGLFGVTTSASSMEGITVFDAIMLISVGVVIGAFAGDAFGAAVRAAVSRAYERVRGAITHNEKPKE